MKISKSLSLKVNLGNYQVADFFVSVEQDFQENSGDKTAVEIAGLIKEISNNLHDFCKAEITKDVNNSKKYLQDLANGKMEVEFNEPPEHLRTKFKPTYNATKTIDLARQFVADEINKQYSDPASDLADGEWNVPEPKRNDKKVN